MVREPTKQELMNEIARYQRLQREQPETDYSTVLDECWRELHEALDREFGEEESRFGELSYSSTLQPLRD